MPAGFETKTPDGWRQLTYGLIYFRLEQKMQLNEAAFQDDNIFGTSGLVLSQTVFVAGLTMADIPVAAMSCINGTFATVSAANGGVNVKVFRVVRPSPSPVTLYVFSKRRPPDPGRGLVFYDAGGPVFSLLTPLLKPIGLIDQNGYVGLSTAGRQCAHISQQRSNSIELNFDVGNLGSCMTTGTSGNPNTPGYLIRRQDFNSTTMIAASGSTVQPDGKTFTGPFTQHQCSLTGAPPSNIYSRQPKYRSLIIDVTNF